MPYSRSPVSPTGQVLLDPRHVECSKMAERSLVDFLRHRLESAGCVDLPECFSTPAETTSFSCATQDGASASGGAGERHQHAAAKGGSSNLHVILVYLNRRVRREYRQIFESMMSELRPTARTAYAQFLGVTEELFNGGVSYGKIVSLYVFCGELAVYCMDRQGMGEAFVASVIGWFVRLYNKRLAAWMAERNGWAGFEQHFMHLIPNAGRLDINGGDEDEKGGANGAWRVTMSGLAIGAIALGYVLSH